MYSFVALGIPVMVHTGNGIPFADPVACIPAANAFPKVKLILAHAGGEMFFEQALMLARNYENVFLEPSWLGVMSCFQQISLQKKQTYLG